MLVKIPKIILLATLFVLVSAAIRDSEAKCERKNDRKIPMFTIDLDKPLRERFQESTVYFKKQLNALFRETK